MSVSAVPAPSSENKARQLLEHCESRMRHLAAELEVVGARLGTPLEGPDDLNLAQELAHTLRGQICGAMMAKELLAGGGAGGEGGRVAQVH